MKVPVTPKLRELMASLCSSSSVPQAVVVKETPEGYVEEARLIAGGGEGVRDAIGTRGDKGVADLWPLGEKVDFSRAGLVPGSVKPADLFGDNPGAERERLDLKRWEDVAASVKREVLSSYKGKKSDVINRFTNPQASAAPNLSGSEALASIVELKIRIAEIEGSRTFGSAEFEDYLSLFNVVLSSIILPSDPCVLKPFLIELYNLCIQVSFAVNGIPLTTLARLAYFDCCKVRLRLDDKMRTVDASFNQLENGMLRGNRVPPYHRKASLSKSSPLLPYVLPCDYRIHAALNCGAASCPPVLSYTVSGLDSELDDAWKGFIEGPQGCVVSKDENGEVENARLSMILKWYSEDFKDGGSVLEKVAKGRSRVEGKGEENWNLQRKIKISYLTYDWGGTGEGKEWKSKGFLGTLKLVL